jgi:cytochrome c peroxidase
MFKPKGVVTAGMFAVAAGCGAQGDSVQTEKVAPTQSALSMTVANAVENEYGVAQTVHASGVIDRTNPFFLALGTNPRSCETCHAAGMGWTLTAEGAHDLFRESQGLDPLFNLVDTGNRPDAVIATLRDRIKTFKPTLVERGLIRFKRTINPAAEFAVTAVVDPSGFSDLTQVLSFRRPTATANESKASSITWTGGPAVVADNLLAVFPGGVKLHEQGAVVPTPAQSAAARDFMIGVNFAQIIDKHAGRLDDDGALGGPTNLVAQPFYLGINDIQGNDPQGHPFTNRSMTLFDAWAKYDRDRDHRHHRCDSAVAEARASIYRGQEIFNSYPIEISGVAGVNDVLGQPVVHGTCTTCHNTPNVGGHSVFRMFNTGVADESRCKSGALPVLTLQNKVTGEIRKVCDMGRATSTGKWNDIGAFRAPPLRGLASREPYFHDGSADELSDVIKFYSSRFGLHLSSSERKDLEAFLGAL